MRIAFIGGFGFNPKGTIRSRAFPLGAELVRQGHEVAIFLPPYDNLDRFWPAVDARGCASPQCGSGGSALSYPRALAKLVRSVDDYHPDLVHIFKPKGFAGAAGTYLLLKNKYPIALDCDDWEGWGGWNEGKAVSLDREGIHRPSGALDDAGRPCGHGCQSSASGARFQSAEKRI